MKRKREFDRTFFLGVVYSENPNLKVCLSFQQPFFIFLSSPKSNKVFKIARFYNSIFSQKWVIPLLFSFILHEKIINHLRFDLNQKNVLGRKNVRKKSYYCCLAHARLTFWSPRFCFTVERKGIGFRWMLTFIIFLHMRHTVHP